MLKLLKVSRIDKGESTANVGHVGQLLCLLQVPFWVAADSLKCWLSALGWRTHQA